MSARRLAIIIVHYKTPEMLADCLASLFPQIDAARDQILIVDNASGEPALGALRRLADVQEQLEICEEFVTQTLPEPLLDRCDFVGCGSFRRSRRG